MAWYWIVILCILGLPLLTLFSTGIWIMLAGLMGVYVALFYSLRNVLRGKKFAFWNNWYEWMYTCCLRYWE